MDLGEANDLAKALFETHNCAQTVLQVVQRAHNLDSPIDPAAALGLGGGIGGVGDVCGALTGGVIAIGVLSARASASSEGARASARQHSRELYRAFATYFGTVDCRVLTGFDLSTAEGQQAFRQSTVKSDTCQRCVEYVIATILSERHLPG